MGTYWESRASNSCLPDAITSKAEKQRAAHTPARKKCREEEKKEVRRKKRNESMRRGRRRKALVENCKKKEAMKN